MFANGFVDLAVSREEVLLVGLAGEEEISRMLVDISTNGFIEELISDDVWLFGHISRYCLPHFG